MSTNWQPTNEAARKERFWRTAPVDPTRPFKKAGIPYRKPGSSFLTPSNFMPVGEHAGKQMQAVPPAYLLWVDDQKWSRTWTGWSTVHDFIDRYIRCDSDALESFDLPPEPFLFLTALKAPSAGDPQIPAFRAGIAKLYTLPGHQYEDLLHAFACGCLNLRTTAYNRGAPPYYQLTVGKHSTALRQGATLTTTEQFTTTRQDWQAWFNRK